MHVRFAKATYCSAQYPICPLHEAMFGMLEGALGVLSDSRKRLWQPP